MGMLQMPDLHQGTSEKLCSKSCRLNLKLDSNLTLWNLLPGKLANIAFNCLAPAMTFCDEIEVSAAPLLPRQAS